MEDADDELADDVDAADDEPFTDDVTAAVDGSDVADSCPTEEYIESGLCSLSREMRCICSSMDLRNGHGRLFAIVNKYNYGFSVKIYTNYYNFAIY